MTVKRIRPHYQPNTHIAYTYIHHHQHVKGAKHRPIRSAIPHDLMAIIIFLAYHIKFMANKGRSNNRLAGPERFAEHGGRTRDSDLSFSPCTIPRRWPASEQLAGFIVMPVGSSGNWYARHWYMGAYFTRLAEPRALWFVISRIFSLVSIPYRYIAFSFSRIVQRCFLLFSTFTLLLDQARSWLPIRAMNYARPLLSSLTCIWLEARVCPFSRTDRAYMEHTRKPLTPNQRPLRNLPYHTQANQSVRTLVDTFYGCIMCAIDTKRFES